MAGFAVNPEVIKALAAISVASAFLYPLIKQLSWRRSVVKTLAVGALAIWAVLLGHFWLAVALALSALGDLALSRDGEKAFLIGMLAFALAHLAYVFLFVAQGLVPFGGWETLAVLVILGIGLWLGPLYAANAGLLAIPVLVYVALIALMAVTALMQQDWAGRWITLAGALMFMASDAILGQEQFLKRHWRGQGLAIWGLYYTAQTALFVGFTQTA